MSAIKRQFRLRTSLQFKLALMFMLVMLASACISVILLVFILRPILISNMQTQVLTCSNAMRNLALMNNGIELEEDYVISTDEIMYVCANDAVSISHIDEKSGEYYSVKIEVSEHNCYIETDGVMPIVTGYTMVNDDYIKIETFESGNIYWIMILVLMLSIIVCIVIGCILTIFFSRMLLKPIRNLSYATTLVARGNFNVKVPLSNDREYNTLIKNFNKMTDELSGIEMLRGDFISSVSHEFKTPLASLQGFAKLLQDEAITEEERSEYAQIIIDESARLSKLTSDILNLSKLENQTTIAKKTRFSIDEQIRNILLILEPEWNKKNIELDLSLDEVYYFGSEELMAQIWQNVINNAIKFTPEGGTIGIRLFHGEKSITARISDNGASIPPEIAERIFDKFYQGDNSRKTEGNGLGLALVKRIVDLCGGKIYVENLYDGGVCFVIELPYIISDMM